MEWKWTNGEPYERTRRPCRVDEKEIHEHDQTFTREIEQSAYASSLHHDENTWDILNQTIYNGFKVSNKREEIDNKIAGRELIQQIGFNPFLDKGNYIDNISDQNKFLKPANTTLEK